MTEKYVFFGRVLPERANFYISKTGLNALVQGKRYKIVFSCHYSLITAEIECPDAEGNIGELKNIIDDVVRDSIDAIGFTNACSYDVAIENAYSLSTQESTIFGVHQPIFDDDQLNASTGEGKPHPELNTESINWQSIRKLAGSIPELGLALSDFREALKQSNFTAFHCYRALDSLRYTAPNIERKDQQWKWLREKLKIQESATDALMKAGGEQRHGKIKPATWEERGKQLLFTWEVLKRYICFHIDPTLLNNLPEIQYAN